ncbi:hypothetical protein OED01_06080 [Microbacterium sp. M28]|uniref:hypothetical protein n=1 Tax=Microbacterium sp. M28 TaxID=2962064 RepID=UPI0021F4C2DE|nr:hypothetical protein [Microbacterium sp. M28]UYO98276.1 hypothetical protein OED01_06080 [Microbacterium sp. M28]
MITHLLRLGIFLASAALGLIVADLVLEDFTIVWAEWWGFLLCIVIFALVQTVLAWIAEKILHRVLPVLVGGVGILSTIIALLIVVLLPIGGLRLDGFAGWIAGGVIVWLVTAIVTVVLTKLLLDDKRKQTRSKA